MSFAATMATEAVLEVRKNVIVIKEVDYRAVDNEFQEFIYDTSANFAILSRCHTFTKY